VFLLATAKSTTEGSRRPRKPPQVDASPLRRVIFAAAAVMVACSSLRTLRPLPPKEMASFWCRGYVSTLPDRLTCFPGLHASGRSRRMVSRSLAAQVLPSISFSH